MQPITCRPDDDIQICENLMKDYQLRRILVVDDEGRCIGIIAQADIALKMTEPREVQETVREISKPVRAA